MDRPLNATILNKKQNVEYVQPQYVIDSLNNTFLLPTSQYRPGIPPPAHLSPFVDNEKEGYMPMRQKEIMHLQGEDVLDSSDEDEEESVQEEPVIKGKKAKKSDEDVIEKGKGDADSSSNEDEESENSDNDQVAVDRKKKSARNAQLKKDLEEENEQMELRKVMMTNK